VTSGLSDGAGEVVMVDEHSQFTVLATSGMIFFRERTARRCLSPSLEDPRFAAQTSCNPAALPVPDNNLVPDSPHGTGGRA
jgi:hypothetical protein